MKAVIQRVKEAKVMVEGEKKGAIESGLLVLVGIKEGDGRADVEWICGKIVKMRVFDDEEGKMNLSVEDVGGSLLVVSQFTLYGDVRKGNRPGYTEAAAPEKAEELYDYMVKYLKEITALNIQTGRFGAYMEVSLVNDGPVTIILER